MPYQLRDYQSVGASRVLRAFGEGFMAPLVVSPTGSGKTVLGCHLIDEVRAVTAGGGRVLFEAHRVEIINQTLGKLQENGLGDSVGVIQGNHWCYRPNAPIQVASVSTLTARLKRINWDFDLVMPDEAHHACAEGYETVLREVRAERIRLRKEPPRIIGLTATPFRADGRPLGTVFDCLIEVTTIPKLMAAGWLVPVVLYGELVDLSKVRRGPRGDYDEQDLGLALNRKKLVGDIVASWKLHAAGRTTVCFASTVEHSMAICERFREAGIKAEHLDDGTPDDQRNSILRRLAEGSIDVLCNCMVLTEGWDLPCCSCVILARPTKSRALWRQIGGRGLRMAPGKSDCVFLDHANNWLEHGEVCSEDEYDLGSAEDIKPKRAPRMFKCENCDASFPARPEECPECGAAFPPPKEREGRQIELPLEQEAPLRLLTPEEIAAARAERKRTKAAESKRRRMERKREPEPAGSTRAKYRFGQLVAEAAAKSWKPEAVAVRFEFSCGRKPVEADMRGASHWLVRTGHGLELVPVGAADAAAGSSQVIQREAAV